MNTILVVATHHGAFLTLESIRKNAPDARLLVATQRSQVDKYNRMYSEIGEVTLKDYDARLKKVSGAPTYVVDDWDNKNPICSALGVLNSLEVSGLVYVVNAGCLVLQDPFTEEFDGHLGLARSRGYKTRDLYKMIGLPDGDPFDSSAFFIRPEKAEKYIGNSDRMIFHLAQSDGQFVELSARYNSKDDPLVTTALNPKTVLEHGRKAAESVCVSYWHNIIRSHYDQEPEELFAYPYDVYLEYANTPHLPESTRARIVENGEFCRKYVAPLRGANPLR